MIDFSGTVNTSAAKLGYTSFASITQAAGSLPRYEPRTSIAIEQHTPCALILLRLLLAAHLAKSVWQGCGCTHLRVCAYTTPASFVCVRDHLIHACRTSCAVS